MAEANQDSNTIRTSKLFRDPFLREAFARAERDNGDTFAIVPVRPITLAGGAAEPMEAEYA